MFGRKKAEPQKEKGTQVYAVLPAAGMSSRMGGINKLMLELDGKPVMRYTLEAFDACDCIDGIVIACRETEIENCRQLCADWNIHKPVIVTAGGETREHSVYQGILACPESVGYVAIHDAARPFITPELIQKTVEIAKRDTAAAPALPVTSSVKKVKDGRMVEDVKRDTIVAVQTPQCFDIDLIRAALCKTLGENLPMTDDCCAAELIGQPTTIVEGDPQNIKITTQADILLGEQIIKERKNQ